MKRFILLLCLVVIGTIIAGFPARWAMGFAAKDLQNFVDADSVGGTIWNGYATITPPGVNWPAKTDFSLKPLGYLTGGAAADLNISAPGTSISGSVGKTSLRDGKISIQIGQLPVVDPRFSGLQGMINSRIDFLDFSKGCVEAKGTVKSNVLAVNQSRWNWAGPSLSGPISCDEGRLRFDLSGENEMLSIISAKIFFSPIGQYEVDVLADIKPGAPAESELVASLLGFQETAEGYRLYEKGNAFIKGGP